MSSYYTTCPRCGAEFYKDQPWKKICVDCWLESKGKHKGTPSSGSSNISEELEQTRIRLSYYIGRCAKLESELARRSSVSGFPDHIMDLIFLAHPDKHENSPKATAVTAWLLDARKELCQ